MSTGDILHVLGQIFQGASCTTTMVSDLNVIKCILVPSPSCPALSHSHGLHSCELKLGQEGLETRRNNAHIVKNGGMETVGQL